MSEFGIRNSLENLSVQYGDGHAFRSRISDRVSDSDPGSRFRAPNFGFRGEGFGMPGKTALCSMEAGRRNLPGEGLRVQGLVFRVQGAGFRVWGLGLRDEGLGLRVQSEGLRVEG